jgi:hypothetical protein
MSNSKNESEKIVSLIEEYSYLLSCYLIEGEDSLDEKDKNRMGELSKIIGKHKNS